MNALEKKALIMRRVCDALLPDFLEVIDESEQHVGHAGHQGGGRHFAIVIHAAALDGLSRVEAHRRIYALFSDVIPDQIHALRIHVQSTS